MFLPVFCQPLPVSNQYCDQCRGWTALIVLTMIAKCHSATAIREFEKNKDLLPRRPGNNVPHVRPHGEFAGGREKESTGVWGSVFIEVEGEGLEFHKLRVYW